MKCRGGGISQPSNAPLFGAGWGASREEWGHFSEILGLTKDLLPVVSNLSAARSPVSTLKSLGKTPSRYNAHRQVVGFSCWTQHITKAADVEMWSAEPDYGICVQTRRLRGIDVDIEDSGAALEVAFSVLRVLGFSASQLVVRFRSNSGRLLIPILYNGALRKRVLKTSTGTIEVLADGQQFVAAGTHPSGERYQWAKLEELLDLRLSLVQ